MKITYNWLKDFVDISLKPETLAERLTMAGLEVTALEKFKDDYIFEIEITSNRPDWLSVAGIAREVAAITNKKIKMVTSHKSQVTSHKGRRTIDDGRFSIIVEDKKTCPFYSARIIRNVRVGASPVWLVKRLRAIGLRPINNIVDITNYILFTTGQPLHAFDLDKIYSHRSQVTGYRLKIIVRRARNGEEIVTIDGIKRKLTQEILVIADENNPIAIAGIMGGKESEVHASTRNILLESAYFSPIVTRRASRLLGLSSDSSYRFERSVDKSKIIDASNFASALILENAGGEVGKLYKHGSDTVSKKIISFDIDKANKVIGQNLPITKTKAILKTLGFKMNSEKENILKVKVPHFRRDIKSQIDVTEELCRIYGYENIPLSLPAVKPEGNGAASDSRSHKPEGNGAASDSRSHKPGGGGLASDSQSHKPGGIQEDETLAMLKRIRETLTALGFSEVITYSLLSEENLKKTGLDLENAAGLENPLSAEQEILRPALLIGLLNALGRNLELGSQQCAFFEIGECFSRMSEFRSLGLLAPRGVLVDKAGLSPPGDLLEFKGKLELLLQKLGIRDYKFSPSSRPFFQEGRCAALIIDEQELGIIGQFKKEILLAFKIDNREALALELDLDKLKTYVNFQKTYQNLPKYPSVTRDISLLAEEGITYQNIAQIIRACGLENLEAVRFKDLYRSEAIGKGKKSLTISLEFRSAEGTLTDIEVKSYMDTILGQLCRELKVELKTAG